MMGAPILILIVLIFLAFIFIVSVVLMYVFNLIVSKLTKNANAGIDPFLFASITTMCVFAVIIYRIFTFDGPWIN